jgi:hypothetical protein
MSNGNLTPEQIEAFLAEITKVAEEGSPFGADPEMTAHLLAVMVAQHEGRVTFTQADMDSVEGCSMGLEFDEAAQTMTVTVTRSAGE